MDEVEEFCQRVLGPGATAEEAATGARALEGADRVELLAAAARACRERAELAGNGASAEIVPPQPEREGLAASVSAEIAAAVAGLPERQREALALRESLRLSHEQISRVMAIELAAVAPLLARARLRLRSERRGTPVELETACADRDRALRILTRRQDSEPLSAEADEWVFEHLAGCEECERAHAAMLEASVSYRIA
jgi:hypothetical protein